MQKYYGLRWGGGTWGVVRHRGRAEGEQKLKIIRTDNALGMVKKSTQGQRTQKTNVSKVRVEPVPLSPHSADTRQSETVFPQHQPFLPGGGGWVPITPPLSQTTTTGHNHRTSFREGAAMTVDSKSTLDINFKGFARYNSTHSVLKRLRQGDRKLESSQGSTVGINSQK